MKKIMIIGAILMIAFNGLTAQHKGHNDVQFAQVIKIDKSMTEEATGKVETRDIYPNSYRITKDEYLLLDSLFKAKSKGVNYWNPACMYIATCSNNTNGIDYIFSPQASFSTSDLSELLSAVNTNKLNVYAIWLENEMHNRQELINIKHNNNVEKSLILSEKRIYIFQFMSGYWEKKHNRL